MNHASAKRTVALVCAGCGIDFLATTSAVNRGAKVGSPVRFCSRSCWAEHHPRRNPTPPSDVERRAAKAVYDADRRERLKDDIRAKKRADYYANHAARLAAMAELRKDPAYIEKMRAYQRDHARRPEWKEHKKKYDRRYRAERLFGEEWADVAVLALDLRDAVAEKASKYEVMLAKGTISKAQGRKRNASSEAQRRRAQGSPVARRSRRSEREP